VQFENRGLSICSVTLSLSVSLFVAAVALPRALEENATEGTHFDYDEGSSKLSEVGSGAGKAEARDDAESPVVGESWPKDPPLQAESVR
jgi:hypothetical protein